MVDRSGGVGWSDPIRWEVHLANRRIELSKTNMIPKWLPYSASKGFSFYGRGHWLEMVDTLIVKQENPVRRNEILADLNRISFACRASFTIFFPTAGRDIEWRTLWIKIMDGGRREPTGKEETGDHLLFFSSFLLKREGEKRCIGVSSVKGQTLRRAIHHRQQVEREVEGWNK